MLWITISYTIRHHANVIVMLGVVFTDTNINCHFNTYANDDTNNPYVPHLHGRGTAAMNFTSTESLP